MPKAVLTLEKEVVSPLIEGNTGRNAEATRDRIIQSGEFRQQQSAKYKVNGGEYDWSVTPSRQLDNPLELGIPIVDEGYTVTASAPGKESVTFEGIKISEYQASLDLNFELPSLPRTLHPAAVINRLNDDQNELTITVTERYTDGYVQELTETFVIRNNSAGTHDVGDHRVYVDTQGNTKIRSIYILDQMTD